MPNEVANASYYTVLLYDAETERHYVQSTETVGGEKITYVYLKRPQKLELDERIPLIKGEFHLYFVYSLFDDDAIRTGLSEVEDLQNQRIFEAKKNEIMHSMDRDNFQNISSPS